MPSEEQMHATAAYMMNRYRLPRFAKVVDGMFVRFDNAPQNIPPTLATLDFNCRKNLIRIQPVAEFGSKSDPDPEHDFFIKIKSKNVQLVNVLDHMSSYICS
jgi:hypothetical protein